MLGELSGVAKIYLVSGYTDMRRSIDMLDYKNEPESILEDLMPWSEMMQETCSLNNHSEI
jgi:hypothetical protein